MMTISVSDDELRQMAGYGVPTAIQEGVRYTTYREHMTNICELERRIHAVEASVAFIAMDRESAEPAPLPAPALTEQAIVEALVRAPGMTGRILAAISLKLGQQGTMSVGIAAGDACRRSDDTLAHAALQSLAVALAAASYRG